jgi:long-chain acyl-CoA synthetase
MDNLTRNADVLRSGYRFSRALDAAGVGLRAGVASLLPNSLESLACYRGSTWSGRRITPISWHWRPDEVHYVVENCEARAFVAHARFAEAALAAAECVPADARFAVGGEISGFRPWSDVEGFDDSPYEKPLAGDIMQYTSGTTGRPKGVRRASLPERPPPTHIASAGARMLEGFIGDAARGGIHLVASPLYHAGPNAYCDGALLLGSDLVLMERFDAERFLALVEHHRVTTTFLVPTHFVRLLRLPAEIRARYDLSSLRMVCHGGAPVSVEIKRSMIEWWGPILYEFYGGTEGGGVMIDSESWLQKPGSVGKPRPGLSVVILSDDGDRLPVGVEGTVYMNEDNPFEYKDEPDKTAEARRGSLITLGDVGYLDEDGFLFLCDRRADVIISGGVNIYPAQIESVILELDYVADCCVVGVPSDEWGESVCAVVEVEAGVDKSAADLSAGVVAHCQERLAGTQVPKRVDLHDGLPRTETGKLARRSIRAPYWEGRERRI